MDTNLVKSSEIDKPVDSGCPTLDSDDEYDVWYDAADLPDCDDPLVETSLLQHDDTGEEESLLMCK